MNFKWENWNFDTQSFNWLLASACIIIGLFLSFRTWKRADRKKLVGFWEIFRILILSLFCFTLFDPQHIEIVRSEIKPQILFLIDESRSMETIDINSSGKILNSRLEFARSIITHSSVKKLEANATVIKRFFSSSKGKTRTNLHDPIQESLSELRNLRALVMITDGDENLGPPAAQLANKLRNSSIPAFTIFTGSNKALPDLDLESLWAPSFTLKEEKLVVGWRIKNSFPDTKESVLILSANEKVVKSIPIKIKGSDQKSGNLSWLPPEDGNYRMELKIKNIKGESFSQNNHKKFKLRVDRKILKVLIIESYPRWEYRFLKNALQRDPGVEVKSLLLHPEMPNAIGENYLAAFPRAKKDLIKFDVVFLGDVGLSKHEMNQDHCTDLADLIMNHAGGLVFLPGRRGRQLSLPESPLGKLIPVVYDQENPLGLGTINPAQFELTDRGRKHWLTQLRGSGEPNRDFWYKLPGFHWAAIVKKSKPGAEVLATHSNFSSKWGKMPILVIRHHGAGKVLFLGSDAVWRWRKGVEDKYHYRFWSQIVRWMAHGRYQAQQDGIRLLSDPEIPNVGDEVFLRCIVMDQAGFPLEDGEIEATATHANGTTEKLDFSLDPESAGIFLSSIFTESPGPLTIEVNELSENRKIKTQLSVIDKNPEKKGRSIVSTSLTGLSNSTSGQARQYSQWSEIIEGVNASIQPKEITKIYRLRTSFTWGIFLFTLLVIYWTGRKLFGMV